MSERIQKILAQASVGSRRQVEQWIKAKRLAINGVVATLGAKVGPGDRVTLDGRSVRLRESESVPGVAVYHRSPQRAAAGGTPARAGKRSKSEGRSPYATAAAEEKGLAPLSSAVLDRLPQRMGRRWISVSPLPPSDSGLELLTTDGHLAQALMRRFNAMRVEFVLRLRGDPRLAQLAHLKSGKLDDGTALQVEAVELAGGEGANRWFKLTVRGGRARDIRRLCSAADLELSRLMRVGLGPVKMERNLARGRIHALEATATAELYALAGLPAPDYRSAGTINSRAGKVAGKNKRRPAQRRKARARR
jgi:23S rRNA pseudouridine2605 synthase